MILKPKTINATKRRNQRTRFRLAHAARMGRIKYFMKKAREDWASTHQATWLDRFKPSWLA